LAAHRKTPYQYSWNAGGTPAKRVSTGDFPEGDFLGVVCLEIDFASKNLDAIATATEVVTNKGGVQKQMPSVGRSTDDPRTKTKEISDAAAAERGFQPRA